MCYICSCISSLLDLVQRLISFGLACCLCGAVLLGLTVAIVAGIAYGYNYCMAEFVTFTRQDVSVYMRRGQFYDKLNIPPLGGRRSGSQEDDLFGANKTTDYEDVPRRSMQSDDFKAQKPLSDVWLKSQDTRKYAESLTKYSPPKLVENPLNRIEQQPDLSQARKSASYPKISETSMEPASLPPVMIPTVTWRRRPSDIVMRNFKPHPDGNTETIDVIMKSTDDTQTTTDRSMKSIGFIGSRQRARGGQGDGKIIDKPSGNAMREWDSTSRPFIPEYVTEDVEEDSIVYKPV